jgi:integrase/recombinase XerD
MIEANPPSFLLPDAKKVPAVRPAVASPSEQVFQACRSWLLKSPSPDTRSNYERDVRQFLVFVGITEDCLETLLSTHPEQVSKWRDALQRDGLTNGSIRRKLTALRSLFSYLQNYGFTGKNPAHSDFVSAPAAPRDGKTVGLSPDDCRRLLDAPIVKHIDKEGKEGLRPAGIRDRALLAVLAYTGCRVGELTRLKVGSYKQNGVHRVLVIHGKGQKERQVPLHPEAAEQLEAWLTVAGIRGDLAGPLFRPVMTARGHGVDGFSPSPLTKRAIQKLIEGYVHRLGLDPSVTVHSFRVTALTTARERGSDIIDLQDFAGHSDPRTTLTYIRTRDRLHESPAYVLKY